MFFEQYKLVNVAMLLFSLTTIAMLYVGMRRPQPSRKRRLLLNAMELYFVATLGNLVMWFAHGVDGVMARHALWLSSGVCYLFGTPIFMLIVTYLYTDTQAEVMEEVRSNQLVKLLWAIAALFMLVVLTNPITHVVFVIDAGNHLMFGTSIWVCRMLLIVEVLLTIVVVVRLRARNGIAVTVRLMLCISIVLIAIGLNYAMPFLNLFYPSLALTLVFLSVIVHVNLEEELVKARASATESRMRLLSGQIHPHFIFNSLNAIKELVVEDPLRAEQSIQDFSDYLRSHLDEMSSMRMVPFSTEMSHVRHYVSLEMADITRPLEVRYELQVEDFMVPPLTVQPLVENAIRHGIRTRDEGGTVTIATWRDERGVVVSVSDDGHGVSSATLRQDERMRVGIANVRERLEVQCAGTLSVESGANGTVALMTLPEGVER